MGVFSEMSMEQEYGNNPASVNIVPTVPAEPEVPAWDEPAETVPPAFEEEPHQQTEPETAPDALDSGQWRTGWRADCAPRFCCG